jgi:serine/threonine-protein kinase
VPDTGERAGEGPALIILACDNISPRPEDAYLADGLHEAILHRLAGVSGIFLLGRETAKWYRENPTPPVEIAAERDLDFIGECSVRKDPNADRILVTFQLLNAHGAHEWSEEYEGDFATADLFDIQRDIAYKVSDAIGASLTSEERSRIEAEPTQVLEAYEAYLIGQYHLWRRDDPARSLSEAIRHFQIAIEQDPNLAAAHAGIAGAYYSMASWGVSDPSDIWPLIEQWALSALALDSTNAHALLELAYSRLARTWDWEETERAFRRAIELNPNDPLGYVDLADLLMAQGRIEEGLHQGRIALALDPLSSTRLYRQARWAFHSRRYQEASPLSEVLVATDPENFMAGYFIALSFLHGGHPERVARLFPDQIGDMAGWALVPPALLAGYLSLIGEADSARIVINEAVSNPDEEYINAWAVWKPFANVGDLDQAFSWLERALEEMSPPTYFLGVTPEADPLRDDPRYQAILDRIGLGHLKARFDSLAAADPRGGS